MKHAEMQRKDYRTYTNNYYCTRDSIVPFYVDLIVSGVDPIGPEVKRVNDLILEKWKPSGLLYIKEKAWKIVVAANPPMGKTIT